MNVYYVACCQLSLDELMLKVYEQIYVSLIWTQSYLKTGRRRHFHVQRTGENSVPAGANVSLSIH